MKAATKKTPHQRDAYTDGAAAFRAIVDDLDAGLSESAPKPDHVLALVERADEVLTAFLAAEPSSWTTLRKSGSNLTALRIDRAGLDRRDALRGSFRVLAQNVRTGGIAFPTTTGGAITVAFLVDETGRQHLRRMVATVRQDLDRYLTEMADVERRIRDRHDAIRRQLETLRADPAGGPLIEAVRAAVGNGDHLLATKLLGVLGYLAALRRWSINSAEVGELIRVEGGAL